MNWVRVSRVNPCPICGKPDWCLISEDGIAAICARIESDMIIGEKGAGWLHRLEEAKPITVPVKNTDVKQAPKAGPDFIDRAYRALLSELTLLNRHRVNLHQRGLNDEEIEILEYKSLSSDQRSELAKKLDVKGISLAGVPGFYHSDGTWQLTGPCGLVIPVRDIVSRIIGLLVRCEGSANGKYKWVSSRNFNAGCSPGAPVHLARQISTNSDIWITEGALKADIAALKLKRTFLGVAGVGNWSGVIPIIRTLKPERVIIAFDMDKVDNPAVRLHANALIECLVRGGMRTFEADWDVNFKGIDDLLYKGAAYD